MTDFSTFGPDRRWVKLDKAQVLPEGIETVCTDGACKNNPNGPAGWGWWRNEDSWAAGGFAVASNNIAELAAIRQALLAAPEQIDLAIVSDSEYAVMACSVWAMGWKRRGWTKADGSGIENLALIQQIHQLLCQRSGHTYLKRVRGHGKDPSMLRAHVEGNAHADRLACEAKELAIAGQVVDCYGPGWDAPVEPIAADEGIECSRCQRAQASTALIYTPHQGQTHQLDLCPPCTEELARFLLPTTAKVPA